MELPVPVMKTVFSGLGSKRGASFTEGPLRKNNTVIQMPGQYMPTSLLKSISGVCVSELGCEKRLCCEKQTKKSIWTEVKLCKSKGTNVLLCDGSGLFSSCYQEAMLYNSMIAVLSCSLYSIEESASVFWKTS